MCQIFMITNGKKIGKLKNLVEVVKEHITERNPDGFGWAAQGVSNQFGERHLELHHKYRIDQKRFEVKLPIVNKTYNSFGTAENISGGIIFHGRISTNHKSLINTHPIRKNGWSLVHNGVVGNKGPEYKKTTTNDSEDLVHYLSSEGIESIEKYLTGYYAFAAIDKDGVMHICRDNNATLFVAWSKKLESYVFGTTIELMEDIATDYKLDLGPIDPIVSDIYMQFKSNDMILQKQIKPRGYDIEQGTLMSKSLSYKKNSINDALFNDNTPSAELRGWDRISAWNDDTITTDVEPRGSSFHYEDCVDLFLDECSKIDASYTIYGVDGNKIDKYKFIKLDDRLKMECNIVRPDGTILSVESIMREVG